MFHVKQNKINKFEIAVVGGGHAGIEAAWVCANMGMRTLLVTLDKKKIGYMSCNPAIGGLAKGQLAREVDALGGLMGRIADESGIHFKMLNTSKGAAVQSPRSQNDRDRYAQIARRYLEKNENITIIEDEGIGVDVDHYKVSHIILKKRGKIRVNAIVLTAGTFLNGIIYTGLRKIAAGRAGELPAKGITESLKTLGFRSGRLKTGTPPRIHKDSVDYNKMIVQEPDKNPQPFSFATERITQRQINCYITHTNKTTHDILREGFDRSPLFGGSIKGIGPRYCPSIEDKINRFADKERHQIFLEPEGYESEEMYVNGFSSSLPGDIQDRAIKTVYGLENVKILRLGYAVEYDFFPPSQIKYTLETKNIAHLYFAGQINGTSGYEEAAAQGLLAGLNASLKIMKKEPFGLKRSEAYMGVLIDDLISKTHDEPYRMFTSRAEFRLLLRQDNADLRLMDYAHKYGLIKPNVYKKFQNRKEKIAGLYKELDRKIGPDIFNQQFKDKSTPISQKATISNLLKRPELKLAQLLELINGDAYSDDVVGEVEFNTKYAGYIERQKALIDKLVKMENRVIPQDVDYNQFNSLSIEAREKLNIIKPENLGQASRISGVTPADISVLAIYLEKYRQTKVPRETSN